MGLLIENELKFLDTVLKKPARPFHLLLGGSKVSDKIRTLDSLLRHADCLLVGGAMAHAFWAAQGDTVPPGARQPNPSDVDSARRILAEAKRRDIPLLVPSDTDEGFDIGPKTIENFCEKLSEAKTVFWNGPLGWFEKPEYAKGTFAVAAHLAGLSSLKIVGGGDTVSAVRPPDTPRV